MNGPRAQRPPSTRGLHHVALNCCDLEACERFYVELLGMQVEWRPDPDNVYLSGGSDNLALHRCTGPRHEAPGALDHIGFIVGEPALVDRWQRWLSDRGVEIVKAAKTHRDGARSFYCRDPDGNLVQLIYHPPLVAGAGQ